MVRRRDGRKRLVKKRRGPTLSNYLHNPRNGVLRSQLHNPEKDANMFVNKETGELVQLHEQTADAHVIYGPPGGDPEKAFAMPDHKFFATHREATRDEIDAAKKTKPAKIEDKTGDAAKIPEKDADKKPA